MAAEATLNAEREKREAEEAARFAALAKADAERERREADEA